MANKFHFQNIIKDGRPAMYFGDKGNDIPFKTWMRNNIGKFGTIEPKEKISPESRGYFEAALCSAYLSHKGKNPDDRVELARVRELFKMKFHSEIVEDLDGNTSKIAKSTAELSRKDFREKFITQVVGYFKEKKIPLPNEQLYKEWKNKWHHRFPLYSYWKFLEVFNLRPDMYPNEVERLLPRDERKAPDYPKENLTPSF